MTVAGGGAATPPLAERKAGLRADSLARRAACDPVLGTMLTAHVLAAGLIPRGAPVGGFWPMGSEMDVRPLLHALHASGHRVALPVTGPRGTALAYRAWAPGTQMERGRGGTEHPAHGEDVVPACFLVPLLAFDRAGRRLGYGGGYYDRTLPLFPGALRLGIAFAAQEVGEVPAGPQDARLHAVATELGVVHCAPDA